MPKNPLSDKNVYFHIFCDQLLSNVIRVLKTCRCSISKLMCYNLNYAYFLCGGGDRLDKLPQNFEC